MNKELEAAEWQGLTKGERAAVCRRFAAEAERETQSARQALKQTYKDIAAQWH
jgi:predicted Fe-S protein YdhL (DUF1289 family)